MVQAKQDQHNHKNDQKPNEPNVPSLPMEQDDQPSELTKEAILEYLDKATKKLEEFQKVINENWLVSESNKKFLEEILINVKKRSPFNRWILSKNWYQKTQRWNSEKMRWTHYKTR
ncbi:hypothetical protein [Metamycoplasma arthritidis]|uniref:Uncharacterized protein n=1 Tax=Metamycoplasma arthritidis (strain 158L3-1) TaxID=243272 RepID=B3PM90_META1|nr:hypothetical protein [Metamycoplasma arthritidis]ACF07142.1 hypothetical protein MARTH_orf232 [Metamycoplasma arthritidis 158L3-1]